MRKSVGKMRKTWPLLLLLLTQEISKTDAFPRIRFHPAPQPQIRGESCTTRLGAGQCTYVWSCWRAGGTHIGLCRDKFFIGSCCKHSSTNANSLESNLIPTDVTYSNRTLESDTTKIPEEVNNVQFKLSQNSDLQSQEPTSSSSNESPEPTPTDRQNLNNSQAQVAEGTTIAPVTTIGEMKSEEPVSLSGASSSVLSNVEPQNSGTSSVEGTKEKGSEAFETTVGSDQLSSTFASTSIAKFETTSEAQSTTNAENGISTVDSSTEATTRTLAKSGVSNSSFQGSLASNQTISGQGEITVGLVYETTTEQAKTVPLSSSLEVDESLLVPNPVFSNVDDASLVPDFTLAETSAPESTTEALLEIYSENANDEVDSFVGNEQLRSENAGVSNVVETAPDETSTDLYVTTSERINSDESSTTVPGQSDERKIATVLNSTLVSNGVAESSTDVGALMAEGMFENSDSTEVYPKINELVNDLETNFIDGSLTAEETTIVPSGSSVFPPLSIIGTMNVNEVPGLIDTPEVVQTMEPEPYKCANDPVCVWQQLLGTDIPVSATDNLVNFSENQTHKPPLTPSPTFSVPTLKLSTEKPKDKVLSEEDQRIILLLNMKKTADVCGRPVVSQARIVNGKQASFGQFPWQIAMYTRRPLSTGDPKLKCGAVLLEHNWVVTAAHCLEGVKTADIFLRLGEYDLESEDEQFGHEDRQVSEVITHPKFKVATFENDIALLRLKQPVIYQPNIIPICLPDGDQTYAGRTGIVTGWGRLSEGGPLPSVLQNVDLPILSNNECEQMYKRAGSVQDIPEANFLCAGFKDGKQDACDGDSGGPMVLEEDGRHVLIGIVSWGIDCAAPNQPGAYTRVTKYKEWIDINMARARRIKPNKAKNRG